MAAPYIGGFAITSAEWTATRAILVRFTTTYGTSYHYQLYAGRTLIGQTIGVGDLSILGQLTPSESPQELQLVAVDPSARLTDYGSLLPPRPYNRAKLTFTVSAWPADSKLIEVLAGTTPGGAVDSTNIVERILYDTDRQYTVTTPPMDASGVWNFEARGRDNRPADGNAGSSLALSVTLDVHPPDVVLQSDDTRFSVAVAGGVLTASFEVAA